MRKILVLPVLLLALGLPAAQAAVGRPPWTKPRRPKSVRCSGQGRAVHLQLGIG